MNEVEELLKKIVQYKSVEGKIDKKSVRKGLYRRYDGAFIIVQDVVSLADGEVYAVHYPIDNPNALRMTEIFDFAGYFYPVDVYDNGEVVHTTKSILEHPSNVTGQAQCHIRVESIDNFERNLSTECLLNELRKREDNPYSGLDEESVEFTDYTIAVHGEDDRGEYMVNEESWDTLEKALENKVKFNSMHNVYKRSYVKAN